jgi:hypothetical protein
MRFDKKDFFVIFSVLTAVVISYFIFGAPYSFRFNTDNAVHVLMAADFDWTEDFYYWAQNRLGSFSALLGSWLVKIGVAPIHAVTVVKYGWIISIIFFAGKLIKNRWLTIILALTLLFPSVYHFRLLQLAHPYPEQISAILFAAVFFKSAIENRSDVGILRMAGIGIFSALALWVNDATFVFIGIFIVALSIAQWQKLIKLTRGSVLSFILGLGIPAAYIIYRKVTTIDYTGYGQQSVNSLSVFAGSLVSWYKEYLPFFSNDEPIFLSTYFAALLPIFVFAGFVFIGYILVKRKSTLSELLIPALLIATATTLYVLVCLSEWYIKNESNSRYLISSFYLFLIGIFILINQRKQDTKTPAASLILLSSVLVVIGAITGLTMTKTSRFSIDEDQKDELKQLYGKGLISNYWFSYAISAHAPDKIAATPRAGDWMRSHEEKNKVLESDTIYIVKTQWLESYPDTIEQWGVYMKKMEPLHEISVGNATMAGYKRIYN